VVNAAQGRGNVRTYGAALRACSDRGGVGERDEHLRLSECEISFRGV